MTKPDLFVYLAFTVSWLLIAAWAFHIGRKVNRLASRMDTDT